MSEDNKLFEIYNKFLQGSVIKEGVENAVPELPYTLTQSDIDFMDQFPDVYKAQALLKRFDFLYNYLLHLNHMRMMVYEEEYDNILNSEKKYWNSRLGTWSPLAQTETLRLQADAQAKARAVQLFPAGYPIGDVNKGKYFKYWKGMSEPQKKSIIRTKDAINDYFLNDSQKKIFSNFKAGAEKAHHYKASANVGALAKTLEGTHGKRDGYDLFNPERIQYDVVKKEDGGKTKKLVGKHRIKDKPKFKTDTFMFPTLNVIKRQLENQIIAQSTGKIQKDDDMKSLKGKKDSDIVANHVDYKHDHGANDVYNQLIKKITQNLIRDSKAAKKAGEKELSKQQIDAEARKIAFQVMKQYFPDRTFEVDSKNDVSSDTDEPADYLKDIANLSRDALKKISGIAAGTEDPDQTNFDKPKPVVKTGFLTGLKEKYPQLAAQLESLDLPYGGTTMESRTKDFDKNRGMIKSLHRYAAINDPLVKQKVQFRKETPIQVNKKVTDKIERVDIDGNTIPIDPTDEKHTKTLVLKPSDYIEPLKLARPANYGMLSYKDKSGKKAQMLVDKTDNEYAIDKNTGRLIFLPYRNDPSLFRPRYTEENVVLIDPKQSGNYRSTNNKSPFVDFGKSSKFNRGEKIFDPVLFERLLKRYAALNFTLTAPDGSKIKLTNEQKNEIRVLFLNLGLNLNNTNDDIKNIYEFSKRAMWQKGYQHKYKQGSSTSSTFSLHPTRHTAKSEFLSRHHNSNEVEVNISAINAGVIENTRSTSIIPTITYINNYVNNWLTAKTSKDMDELAAIFLLRTKDILNGLVQHRLLESMGDERLYISIPDPADSTKRKKVLLASALNKKIIIPELTRYMKQDVAFIGSYRTRGQFIKLLRQNEDLIRCKMQQRRHEAGNCVLGMDLRTINRILTVNGVKIQSIPKYFRGKTDIYQERSKIRAIIEGYINLFSMLFQLYKIEFEMVDKLKGTKLENAAAFQVTKFAKDNVRLDSGDFVNSWHAEASRLLSKFGLPDNKDSSLISDKGKLIDPDKLRQQFGSEERGVFPATTENPETTMSNQDPQVIVQEIMEQVKTFPYLVESLISTISKDLPEHLKQKVENLLATNKELSAMRKKIVEINTKDYAIANYQNMFNIFENTKTDEQNFQLMKENLPYIDNSKIRQNIQTWAFWHDRDEYYIRNLMKLTKKKKRHELLKLTTPIQFNSITFTPDIIKLLLNDKGRKKIAALQFKEVDRRGKELYDVIQRETATNDKWRLQYERFLKDVRKFQEENPKIIEKL
jgi:hypothetical protein